MVPRHLEPTKQVETEPKEPKTMTTGRDHDDESPVELIVRPWDRPGEAKPLA
jgi:hypothetical protein